MDSFKPSTECERKFELGFTSLRLGSGCVGRSEPVPRLPVQGPVQHETVSLLFGGSRVRSGPMPDVRRRPIRRDARHLQERQRPARPAQAPVDGAVRRRWLGHLCQRDGPEERVHLRVLRRDYLAGRSRPARQSLRQIHVLFPLQLEQRYVLHPL